MGEVGKQRLELEGSRTIIHGVPQFDIPEEPANEYPQSKQGNGPLNTLFSGTVDDPMPWAWFESSKGLGETNPTSS